MCRSVGPGERTVIEQRGEDVDLADRYELVAVGDRRLSGILPLRHGFPFRSLTTRATRPHRTGITPTAALTRPGAEKASKTVMSRWRMLPARNAIRPPGRDGSEISASILFAQVIGG